VRTLRGALVGAIVLMLTATGLSGVAHAATPISPPYTALTVHFEGWGYIDGSFSYEASRNTLDVQQQTPNGYALQMLGFAGNHDHYINVTPPIGTRFTAGQSYPTEVNFSPQPDMTVINLGGDGQGCDWSPTPGTLTVLQADYDDSTGQFTAFAATYSTPCRGTAVAKGEIRLQSSITYKATDTWAYQLQFKQQPAGLPGTPQDVTVEVNGTEPTTFGAASLSGAEPGSFEITANTCSDQTLSYGQTCALTVTPKASALGDQTAILTLVENSVAGHVLRLLSLQGIDPRDATASPGYFDFGTVAAYDTSAPKTVTLTGASTLPITFGTGSIVGANASDFTIETDGCSGQTLAQGESCSVTAVARPTSPTGIGAQFVLPDDSFAGSSAITLAVNGYTSDRGTYYPVSPYRIMDTRTGRGVRKGTVGPGGVLHLQVTGSGGVPDEASTVVLNVTITGATAASYLTVYPTGVARPLASSLNFVRGWTRANSVTVKLGSGGRLDFYNASGNVHVIADVFGYYSIGKPCCGGGDIGGQYHPLSQPIRLTDTRTWNAGRVPGGFYINSAATWGGTINPKIRAFAVNVTATQPSAGGYLTAWNGDPDGLPNTSTVNYTRSATVPNFAVVPAMPCIDCGSATGLPSIGVYTSTPTHIIVDLVGYYDDSSLSNGLRFTPVVPTRIADSRTGQGLPSRIGPTGTATITTPDSMANVDTWALATNVTAVQPTANTYLAIWPAGIDGVPRPTTSNLNPTAGSVVPNAVQTMVGPTKQFNVYNSAGFCDVVVDVVGTFYLYPPTQLSGVDRAQASGRQPFQVAPAAAATSLRIKHV
jgi:hypothetical protein